MQGDTVCNLKHSLASLTTCEWLRMIGNTKRGAADTHTHTHVDRDCKLKLFKASITHSVLAVEGGLL